MKRSALLFAAVLMSNAAFAHEPTPGPNGGLKVDALPWHAELIADGTTKVKLVILDDSDKPIAVDGFSANAIFLIDGKPARFALVPEGTMLVGDSPAAVAPGVKGAIQIAGPNGVKAQAKY
jgi:hypothetical protein